MNSSTGMTVAMATPMSWCVSRCPEAFTTVWRWQRNRSPLRNARCCLTAAACPGNRQWSTMGATARSDAEPGGPSPTGPCLGRRGANSRIFGVCAANARLSSRLARPRALGRSSRRKVFTVPQNKDLKRLVRARMAETGGNYTQALSQLQGQVELEPLPAAWQITGSRAREYEMGLRPGISYEG